jgi:predicted esterase
MTAAGWVHRLVFVIVGVGLASVTVALLRFGSAGLFTLALAAPVFDERWIAPWYAIPAIEAVDVPVGATTLRADLYHPRAPRAAVLLVHGLSPAGNRHPELVRLARVFARQGFTVLVPRFEGLAMFHLSGREIDEIKAALAELRRRSGAVAVAGFSFGAGPALVAAAETEGLAWVGSFGGYADLRNVVVYLTTGVHTFQNHRYAGRVEEYNRWKLAALLTPFVQDERDRQRVERIASRGLANPSSDVGTLVAELGPSGRAVMNLVRSQQEDRTRELLDRLSPGALAELARLSPIAVVQRLRTRLLIAHGADDDSIPFTESLRLAEAAGPRARVVVLQTFHHTGPARVWTSLRRRAVDTAALLLLADEMLRTR